MRRKQYRGKDDALTSLRNDRGALQSKQIIDIDIFNHSN
jgi:hypothetical protein